MVRNLYRKTIPYPIRYWIQRRISNWKNLFDDRAPRTLTLPDYDAYWLGRTSREGGEGISHDPLIDICQRVIQPNSRVLDFGCGGGQLLAKLKETNYIDEFGLDISTKAVEIAKKRGIEVQVFELKKEHDLEEFGQFDYAIATEVLEHVPNSELFLVALSNVADKVIISIPNTGFYLYRLRLLLGRFPRQWHEHPSEHIRYWTLQDFQFMLTWLGLKQVDMIGFGSGGVVHYWPGIFAQNLLFVIAKHSDDFE